MDRKQSFDDPLFPRITEEEDNTPEALGLESVPFFDRPIGASEKDQWVGMDDAGNNVYRMGNGNTYTVKPNQDQRTSRIKFEEDVVPAVKDYIEDPSLPSAEQMLQFGEAAVVGAYESVKGAMDGTGTMGDVFGVVPTMAVGSAVAEVPEGAIRLFGGRKATSPGVTETGAPLPESFGADGEYRFEIDDSLATVDVNRIPNIPTGPNGEITVATLGRALDHSELFYQYPEMADIKVYFDPELEKKGFNGIYYPGDKLVGLNPRLKDNPTELKSVLLHEVQHDMQMREDFAYGANPNSDQVKALTPEEQQIYNQEVQVRSEQINQMVKPEQIENALDTLILSGLEELKAYGLDPQVLLERGYKGAINTKAVLNHPQSSDIIYLIKGMEAMDIVFDSMNSINQGGVAIPVANLEVYLPKFLAELSPDRRNQTLQKLGVDPVAFEDVDPTYFGVEFVSKAFGVPSHPNPNLAHRVYRRAMGEVEARNVQKRMNMSTEERFGMPAEYTEDVRRDRQWNPGTTTSQPAAAISVPRYKPKSNGVEAGMPDAVYGSTYLKELMPDAPVSESLGYAEGGLVRNYNEGGVIPMEEQMKVMEEGGIADDGMSRDPVSGNEIPPGSLAKEVRDDVDAKLSEGEYVVPADVVRYFGVAYFEKLREKAKKGMGEMAEDGRIGGAPVGEMEEEGDDDDLPFSDEELMAVDDGQEAPVEMAQGGPVFNPNNFQPGFSTQGSGIQTRTFVNSKGEQRSIMFVNGQPIQQIPAGFVEGTAENRAELTRAQNPATIPAGEVPTQDGGVGTDATDGGFAQEGPDIGSMDAEALADFAQNDFQGMQGLANAAAVFGGPLGLAANAGVQNTGRAIAARAQELGVPNPAAKSGKQGLIGRAINAVTGRGSDSIAMGQGMDGNFAADYAAASAHAAANPTGTTTGRGLSVSDVPAAMQGLAAPAPSVSSSGSTGGGGSSSGGSSGGTSGGMGDGPGYGGWAARGMLVDKRVTQKQKPKPEGKGLVKRKPKNK